MRLKPKIPKEIFLAASLFMLVFGWVLLPKSCTYNPTPYDELITRTGAIEGVQRICGKQGCRCRYFLDAEAQYLWADLPIDCKKDRKLSQLKEGDRITVKVIMNRHSGKVRELSYKGERLIEYDALLETRLTKRDRENAFFRPIAWISLTAFLVSGGLLLLFRWRRQTHRSDD